MSLLAEFLAIVRDWRSVFPQQRALAYCPQRLVGVAIDDTRLQRRAASFRRRSISATRCRRRFMSI